MQNADISQQVKGGGLSIGISVDETPSDEQMLRKMGMVHDDARAEDIGGFVVDVSERMDPSAQLGIIGPQVVVGRVTVTATAAGIALQKVESMEYITNDQAIEAAIAIHRMLR